MNCKQCNQPNPEDAPFCAYCGSPLPPAEPSQYANSTSYEAPNDLPYAAPVNAPYAAPFQASACSETNGNGYVPWEASVPPKKKGKLWLLIPAVVVSLALVAFLVVKLLVWNDPRSRVVKGVTNSISALNESVGNAETFHKLIQTLSDCSRGDGAALDLSMDDLYGGSDSIALSYALNQKEKLMRSDLSVSINGIDLDLTLAADETDLMLHLAQMDDQLYSLPLKNFGTEYTGSPLSDLLLSATQGNTTMEEVNDLLETLSIDPFAKTDLQTFREAREAFDNFVAALEIEKTEEDIPNTRDLTVYRTVLNAGELMDLYMEYYSFALVQYLGEEAAEKLTAPGGLLDDLVSQWDIEEDQNLILYLGLNKEKCLTAIHCYEEGSPLDSFSVILEGENNLWENVGIYKNKDAIAGFSVTETVEGFSIVLYEIYDGEQETLFQIQCDDLKKELTLLAEEELFTIDYDLTGSLCSFFLELPEESGTVGLSISKAEPITLPEGTRVPLLTYDEEDYMELVQKVISIFY